MTSLFCSNAPRLVSWGTLYGNARQWKRCTRQSSWQVGTLERDTNSLGGTVLISTVHPLIYCADHAVCVKILSPVQPVSGVPRKRLGCQHG